MPNRLIAPSRVPYGGQYILNLPQNAMVGHGNNFEALLRSITEWRKANSVPIGLGFEDEVEQAVCGKYSVECEDTSIARPRTTRLSLAAVIRGTQVLLEFKLAGSPLVAREEAERRASICAGCAFNQEYATPCGGNCGGLKELVSAIVGGGGTSFDDRLKSCSICSCVASAHVWLPLPILAKGVTNQMREQFATIEHCWKNV